MLDFYQIRSKLWGVKLSWFLFILQYGSGTFSYFVKKEVPDLCTIADDCREERVRRENKRGPDVQPQCRGVIRRPWEIRTWCNFLNHYTGFTLLKHLEGRFPHLKPCRDTSVSASSNLPDLLLQRRVGLSLKERLGNPLHHRLHQLFLGKERRLCFQCIFTWDQRYGARLLRLQQHEKMVRKAVFWTVFICD